MKENCPFALKVNLGRGYVCSLCGKGCHTIDKKACTKLQNKKYKRRGIN